MDPTSTTSNDVMMADALPSDSIECHIGNASSGSPPSEEATEPSTPGSIVDTPPGDGIATGRSYLFVHDPVTDAGHVLPQNPPPIHEHDATWNELVGKLVVIAGVHRYTQVELDWIVRYPEGSSNRYAQSLHFWTAAAERFNDHFDCEVAGKALRKQFLKCVKWRRVRRTQREGVGA